MKKKALVIVLVLSLGIILFSGCASGKRQGLTSDKKTVTVEKKDIQSVVSLSGIVKTEPRVVVPSKVSGEVTDLFVKEGSVVSKGDKICHIDSKTAELNYQNTLNAYKSASLNYKIAEATDPNTAVSQAKANVGSAQAALEIAKLNAKIAQESDNSSLQVKNAQEQVKQSEINLDNAKTNLDSLQKSDTTAETIENAKLQVQNQQLVLATAQLNLKGLKESGPTDDDISQAEQQIQQAKINKENAEQNLKKATDNPNTQDEDVKILENQVDLADISIKNAELTLDKLKNHSAPTDEQVSQAENQVEQAKISLRIAQQNYQSALKSKTAKDAQIVQAENQVKLATSQLNAANNNLQTAQNGASSSPDTISIRNEQVKQSEGSLKVAQANLNNANEQVKINSMRAQQAEAQKEQAYTNLQTIQDTLDNYTITAPISGTVLSLNVSAGDTVSPGMKIAVVGDTKHFVADAFADEIDAVSLKKGQSAVLSFDAFPHKTLKGNVESVGYTTITTGQGIQAYEVKVTIPKTDLSIMDGLSSTIDVTTSERKGVLAVPIESVATTEGKSYVAIISSDGKVEKRFVETGASSDNYTEIISGLKEGEKILEIPDENIFKSIQTKGPLGGSKKGGG